LLAGLFFGALGGLVVPPCLCVTGVSLVPLSLPLGILYRQAVVVDAEQRGGHQQQASYIR
jgi:hypothetical protein